jgi:hypothetical protein
LASYTQPGTIHIFHSLEPIVKCIIFGRVTDDLRRDIFSLLASEALAIAAHEDSQGLRRQGTANSWIMIEICALFIPIILLLHNGFSGFTIVKLLPFIPAL